MWKSFEHRAAARPTEAPAAAPADHLPRHIPGLDGLRGIAIVLVMVFHFVGVTPPPAGPFVSRAAYKLLLVGWVGVDLFFVLSGFLITGILYDAKGSDRYFRNFYVRRGLRIFPLYYAVLAVVIVVLPRVVGPAPPHAPPHWPWWYWSYLTNVLVARYGFPALPFDSGHLWSLAVEEQFYVVWPLAVWRLDRRALVRLSVGVVVAAAALRVALVAFGAPADAVYVLLPTRADALVAGALLALAARGDGGLARVRRAAAPAAAAALATLAALFVVRRGLAFNDAAVQVAGFPALAVLASALLVGAVGVAPTSPAGRLLTHPVLRWFGRYSYGLYLVHHFLRYPLWGRAAPYLAGPRGGTTWGARALFVVAGIGASAAVAFASWHLFERHLLRLKRLFPLEPRPAAARAARPGPAGRPRGEAA